MIEETEIQKLKEENPEFFRRTPPEVIDFVFSEKTSEKIADIAVKNGVGEEKQVEEIAFRVVWVLLGRLPSGNLAMTLELGVKLTPEIAKKIADEANQFIASSLDQLKPETNTQPKKELPKEITTEEKPKRPLGKDTYREQI